MPFFLILFIIILLLFLFSGFRLITNSLRYFCRTLSKRRRILLSVSILILLLLPALSMQSVWTLIILYLIGFSAVCSLIFIIINRFLPLRVYQILHFSRIVPILAAVSFSLYGVYNMTHPICTEYTISSEKPIRSEGYRVALISDLHHGTVTDSASLQRYAALIKEQKPDLILLAGDLVDENTTNDELFDAFSTLGAIPAPLGIYYVYGNHDRSLYSSQPNYTTDELIAALTDANIQILQDSSVSVTEDLILIGREDASVSGRASIDTITQELDPDAFWLLMDHQPTDYDAVSDAGIDLIVSGHTHAGQIWPGGLLTELIHKDSLNYGYKKINSMHAIVSSGIAGWGFPARTERHCEFVMITIEHVQE